MKITYSQSIANAAVGATKITQKCGAFSVGYTTAAGVHNQALYTMYDEAGTPKTALTAGGGTEFSISKDTGAKVNVYWETSMLKVQNNSGETLYIKVEGEFYSN